MKTVTVELTQEYAEVVLSSLEKECDELRRKLSQTEKQVNHLRKSLAQTTEQIPLDIVPAKTGTGRAIRGQSEKAILSFITVGGSGVTISDICRQTGTKYGSAHRILHKLKDQGIAKNVSDFWYRVK
jgi:hypothetical protein